MADVVKALALLVQIAPVGVRVPGSGSTENGHWGDPPTEGGPNSPTGREWKTSKMIGEPRLDKNQKKKEKINFPFSA